MVCRPEKRREMLVSRSAYWALFSRWITLWLTLVAVLARTLYCSSRRRRSSSLGTLKRVMRSMGAILGVVVGGRLGLRLGGGFWRVDGVVDIDLEAIVRGRVRMEFVRLRSIGGSVLQDALYSLPVLFLAGLLRIGGVPMGGRDRIITWLIPIVR